MKSEIPIYPPPRKLKAFTLSEVLITLVVIGVVAAITMPILIADWQKNATVERLKKAYSTLSNALTTSVAMNGPMETWTIPSAIAVGHTPVTKETNKEFAEEYLMPYLNVAQVCEYGKDDACNYQVTNSGYLVGNKAHDFLINKREYGFALADGTTVAVSASFLDDEYGGSNITVDINGPKKPNKIGRDVFAFQITSRDYTIDKILDSGCGSESRETCLDLCKNASRGFCTGIIMKDSWQIKRDYPW